MPSPYGKADSDPPPGLRNRKSPANPNDLRKVAKQIS